MKQPEICYKIHNFIFGQFGPKTKGGRSFGNVRFFSLGLTTCWLQSRTRFSVVLIVRGSE